MILGFLAIVVVDGWWSFGGRPDSEHRARLAKSPQWKDGVFVNPEPLHNEWWPALRDAFAISPHASPTAPVPVEPFDPKRLDSPPASGLRVTWFGHSSTLVEVDGHRVLFDPIWSERASPLTWLGPTRYFPPLVALDALPPIDVVAISHDHYDHLDARTLAAMKGWTQTTFVVPLAVSAHLVKWGVPKERIVELDWWDQVTVKGLTVVCTPARHASGRMLIDDDSKLWAGWALLGPAHRVYYSGDTGLFPAMRDIGQRLGPFDLTLIEVGQYHRAWPDWHAGPEQAVRAHQLVRGAVFLPVHWGAFALAYHGWTEPAERALAAARAANVSIIIPRPGQSVEPSAPPPFERWWPDLPWRTGAQDPIVSTKLEALNAAATP